MKRKFYTPGNTAMIKIKNKRVSRPAVKMFYRCEECLSKLEYFGAGLRCTANPDHFGFIHQNEADEIKCQREAKITEIETAYQIVDGVVVYKES